MLMKYGTNIAVMYTSYYSLQKFFSHRIYSYYNFVIHNMLQVYAHIHYYLNGHE